jgi:hypothetical protein
LEPTWAAATRFLSGLPPTAPIIAVTVVLTPVPAANAAAASSPSTPLCGAERALIIAAELDRITAVKATPSKAIDHSGSPANGLTSNWVAKRSTPCFMRSSPNSSRPSPTISIGISRRRPPRGSRALPSPPAPSGASASVDRSSLNPSVGTSQAVAVVPRLAPRFTPIAPASGRTSAPTQASTSSETG